MGGGESVNGFWKNKCPRCWNMTQMNTLWTLLETKTHQNVITNEGKKLLEFEEISLTKCWNDESCCVL